jgi:hypothetical protein
MIEGLTLPSLRAQSLAYGSTLISGNKELIVGCPGGGTSDYNVQIFKSWP